jgi:hypothetical protein
MQEPTRVQLRKAHVGRAWPKPARLPGAQSPTPTQKDHRAQTTDVPRPARPFYHPAPNQKNLLASPLAPPAASQRPPTVSRSSQNESAGLPESAGVTTPPPLRPHRGHLQSPALINPSWLRAFVCHFFGSHKATKAQSYGQLALLEELYS